MSKLRHILIELAEANVFVARHHRHHGQRGFLVCVACPEATPIAEAAE